MIFNLYSMYLIIFSLFFYYLLLNILTNSAEVCHMEQEYPYPESTHFEQQKTVQVGLKKAKGAFQV